MTANPMTNQNSKSSAFPGTATPPRSGITNAIGEIHRMASDIDALLDGLTTQLDPVLTTPPLRPAPEQIPDTSACQMESMLHDLALRLASIHSGLTDLAGRVRL